MNSTARYWYDWKPDEVPRKLRNSAYSLGVRVASTDHCSVSVRWMCLTRARPLSAGRRSSLASCRWTARNSCSTSLSHSSEVWCWRMNSSSSWCSGTLTGCCASRISSRCRYRPYERLTLKSRTMPSSRGRLSLATPAADHTGSDVGERAVGKDRPPVHPLTLVPDEPAALDHVAGFAVVAVVRPELDDALGVEHPAAAGLQHVEAGPAQMRVGFDGGRPGVRVPGAQHVRVVVQREGRVPRPH